MTFIAGERNSTPGLACSVVAVIVHFRFTNKIKLTSNQWLKIKHFSWAALSQLSSGLTLWLGIFTKHLVRELFSLTSGTFRYKEGPKVTVMTMTLYSISFNNICLLNWLDTFRLKGLYGLVLISAVYLYLHHNRFYFPSYFGCQ